MTEFKRIIKAGFINSKEAARFLSPPCWWSPSLFRLCFYYFISRVLYFSLDVIRDKVDVRFTSPQTPQKAKSCF